MNWTITIIFVCGLFFAGGVLADERPPQQPGEPLGESQQDSSARVLYNGIRLPPTWPPRADDFTDEPVTPPYLKSPPEVILIDVGRQLLVDDFLVASTTLKRTFHQPKYFDGNPVLKPDRPWEMNEGEPFALPFSDGIWFDPEDGLLKLWYYGTFTCYATSQDGIHWEKPELDVVPGTNIVDRRRRDSNTVWLDARATDPQRRFKMAQYCKDPDPRFPDVHFLLFHSADGIHWSEPVGGLPTGDRSTFFYNPFRNVWVYSIRGGSRLGRCRHYWETNDFYSPARDGWKGGLAVWAASDSLDWPREDLQARPQLYNLDCVAYESLLLGFFSIWRGDYRHNRTTERAKELLELGRPKQNSICLGFSRDGFHWDRPDRRAFCPTSEKMGDWNWGNVQSVANGCLVMGDELYIYVSGRAGKGFPGSVSLDAGGTTGLAILRRDGFASMDAAAQPGTLTTRPVRFRGQHLFVNVAADQGELRAEVLDGDGKVVAPFTRENCQPVKNDSTLAEVRWQGAADLSAVSGKPVRFRFHLRNSSLYAFWVSPDASGASHGYVSAGGPGLAGPVDTVGRASLRPTSSSAR